VTEQPDYYAILEIEPTASRKEIERAYEVLASRYQPDPDQAPAEPEKMRLVNEAFDVLDDPERRASYHEARQLPPPSTATRGRVPDARTLFAFAIMLGGAAALIAGIVLGVLVVLDDDPAYVELDSGLKFRDIAEGSGDYPPPGSLVAVHYTGMREDGTVFDSSVGGEPFRFELGRGQVIQGWDQGISSMRVGGRRELIVPPELGYGETGYGDLIPPNATLIFEVELVSVETPDGD
jgi:peptidylprolyl isomerase